VAGPDGALWFTLAGATIGRITTPVGTTNTSPLLAAVLPSSRSVEVGNTGTAFATIINSGSSTAGGCAIVPVTSVPASFV
jgi:streptogramin lyase